MEPPRRNQGFNLPTVFEMQEDYEAGDIIETQRLKQENKAKEDELLAKAKDLISQYPQITISGLAGILKIDRMKAIEILNKVIKK